MGSIFKTETTPLICVPITAKTTDELMKQVADVVALQPDVIEWRADFFDLLNDTEVVIRAINQIKEMTDIPLLFTIRSEKEGGERVVLNEAEKVTLLTTICDKTNVDAVDYEVENDPSFVKTIQEVAVRSKVELILSYHNFSMTPTDEQLINIGSKMEKYGANVAKLAVMPTSRADVNRLLNITTILDESLSVPVITMSMGEIGVLSRIVGWAYGSRLTFAVGVKSSAPGQVSIVPLREAIAAVQAITGT